jgi:hypothetical protein
LPRDQVSVISPDPDREDEAHSLFQLASALELSEPKAKVQKSKKKSNPSTHPDKEEQTNPTESQEDESAEPTKSESTPMTPKVS